MRDHNPLYPSYDKYPESPFFLCTHQIPFYIFEYLTLMGHGRMQFSLRMAKVFIRLNLKELSIYPLINIEIHY
jgi:hypothetical protein